MKELLYPLTFIYSALLKADQALKKSHKLKKPVISVGNITWGGSGKTPMVIELCGFIASKGLKPAVLTRGYGRQGKDNLVLQGGAGGIGVKEAGDEPVLIARSIPQADIIIGSKRYENAIAYEKTNTADIYILDDGFEHWSLQRDLDIVCINAANPFGNGLLIPAGILREKPSALKRAGLIVLTHADMAGDGAVEALKERIFALTGSCPLISQYGGYGIKRLNLKDDFDADELKSKKVFALSGIGFARGFLNSLKRAGIKIEGSFKLKDHQKYEPRLLADILKRAGDCLLICTAKDAVKIDEAADENIGQKIAVLTVKPLMASEDKNRWEKEISKVLALS